MKKGGKLFKERNFIREDTIQGNTVLEFHEKLMESLHQLCAIEIHVLECCKICTLIDSISLLYWEHQNTQLNSHLQPLTVLQIQKTIVLKHLMDPPCYEKSFGIHMQKR